MATSLYFNGRVIVVPQAVGRFDASALQSNSPSAVGVVAVLGTAEGGEPLTCKLSNDASSPGAIRDQYRTGDLRTAALFAFEPSADDAIPNGASKVVPIKVNPATQSTGQLNDAAGNPSLDLTSKDWGLFTAQVNLDVTAGTERGKRVLVNFETTNEVFDNVGGDSKLDVIYDAGSDGYDTLTGVVTAAGFIAAATKAEAGLDAEMTATIPAGFPSTVSVVSDNGADDQVVTVYGIVGTVAAREQVTLTGTTPVVTSQTFVEVFGVTLSAAAAGTLTVSDGANTICTVAATVVSRGVVPTTNTPAGGVVTVSIDADNAHNVAIFGLSPSGAAVQEVFDMTAGNTTPVVGSVAFGRIDVIALGATPAARTISLGLNAVATQHSILSTIQRLADFLNSLDGMTASALVSNATTFLTSDLDHDTASTLIGAAKSFYADIFEVADALTRGSAFVSAARASGAAQGPDNTLTPVYLTGGGEGTTTITQWQAAFALLRKRRVNIIHPVSRDPAVHALLLSHLVERAGRLARTAGEANGYVGIAQADGSAETLANIRSQIQVLQSRHLSFLPQPFERFSPETGLATTYPPHMHGAIPAGMQAGSAVGEPLTRKRPSMTDVFDGPDWTVEDDVDVLIQSGAMVAERVDTEGIRYVRSVTGHLADNNLAFVEMSVNEAANRALFEFRKTMDALIGNRALDAAPETLLGIANDALGRLVTDQVITAYRSLQIEFIGDTFPVSAEIAPVTPINFIPITMHLTPNQAA